MDNQTAPTELLSGLIRQKHGCLEELCALSEKQLERVRGGSMGEVLDVLAAKQQVLLRLQQVERGLDPFRGQDPEARDWPSPGHRRQCAATIAACEALLARIAAQEEQSETELQRRRAEASARLQQTRTAAEARVSYLAPAHLAAGQLDLMSEG
jgi:hypothetical protein